MEELTNKEVKKEEEIIVQRKKKIKELVLGKGIWVVAVLIIAIILGVYIRTLPMTDHGNGKPGLWDYTTNDWTLGPDLDPFLFLRYARTIVDNGSLTRIDTMRYVPLNFDTTTELQMVSYAIVLTYKVSNMFGSYSVNFAGAFEPVLIFPFTILAFFLFVGEIFTRKNEKKTRANIIALISTFFMIVIPTFLSRTVAGIPEKEGLGFLFMFLSFYLFLKAWKSEGMKTAIIMGVLAGIATALMGLSWGGVVYIYVTIGGASLLAFVLNKFGKKELALYSCWFFVSMILTLLFTNRASTNIFTSIRDFLTSLDSGLAFLVFLTVVVHMIIWNTKIKDAKFLKNSKIPKPIISLVAALILVMILGTIVNHSFVLEKARALNEMIFTPVVGRWKTTVAENAKPYFTDWQSNFGPVLGGVPVLFWLFFIGSTVLFRKMLSNIKKKDAWILTGLFVFFLIGMIFSNYSSGSIFNGQDFASEVFFYGSAILILGGLFYYYMRYTREGNNGFEKIDFEYLFILALFVICLFTARTAVRLIMVLGPIGPIFFASLFVDSAARFRKTGDETSKTAFGIAAIVLLLLGVFMFWSFYSQIRQDSYNFVPSYYTHQWQNAMSWVRSNTSSSAVFAHWWDYGYWVQSIGDRATVTDGGNVIVYWNYLMGRLVLTGDNQKDALKFLYSHNATNLLIDSSDLGKYGAFSSIGSDANFDRLSYGPPTMLYDPQSAQETKNGEIRVYKGATAVDEDITYKDNTSSVYIPSGSSAIIGIMIETDNLNNSVKFNQPIAVFYYDGKQTSIPLRYLYYDGRMVDFNSGINGTAYVLPRVSQSSNGLQIDNAGAVMYISPRIMRGLLGQVYILNDPFNNFPNFKLVHTERDIITADLNSQGAKLGEFVYFDNIGGILGPIKIWQINYTGTEKVNPAYIDTDASKYLDWKL